MPASASRSVQPGRANLDSYERNVCAICANDLMWRERTTTLRCGHNYHPHCVEELARHLRYCSTTGDIVVDCPLCREATSMSALSSFDNVQVAPTPRISWIEYARRHPTSERHRSAILTALVRDIFGRALPGCTVPPGWGPCVLEFRRRVLMEPSLPGVPIALEHGVFRLYPELAGDIMGWDNQLTRMLPGDIEPTFPWPPASPYLDDGIGTYTVSLRLFIGLVDACHGCP